jgi:hypothetical protein
VNVNKLSSGICFAVPFFAVPANDTFDDSLFRFASYSLFFFARNSGPFDGDYAITRDDASFSSSSPVDKARRLSSSLILIFGIIVVI